MVRAPRRRQRGVVGDQRGEPIAPGRGRVRQGRADQGVQEALRADQV
uniref:Uncharacterized protein n=1 Tax=Arundo donax TaxID=35708 RepID=A0A0A9FF13_ARUDO